MTVSSGFREEARQIFGSAVLAVDPARLLSSCLSYDPDDDRLTASGIVLPLSSEGRLGIVAVGKAAHSMALSTEKILMERIDDGIAVGLPLERVLLRRITYHPSSHPLPDERSIEAGGKIFRMAEGLGDGDLLLLLLSGGASALMEFPAEGLLLNDLQMVNRLLLSSGAAIREINCVRKHLSVIKGGGLARAAYPARIAAFILSDCYGSDLSVIASGPSSPDPTTFHEAHEILRRHQLISKVPRSVCERIEKGCRGEIPETPKPGDPLFERVRHEIIGENRTALEGARAAAEQRGYRAIIMERFLAKEAREEAVEFLRRVDVMNLPPRSAVIAGGECVVTVTGDGTGGRNQEFLAALSDLISGRKDLCILSAGTDGIDGPTEAAGGIVDGGTLKRAESAGFSLDQTLRKNDAYTFLKASGDLLITGPTGTNVMDVIILLKN